MWTTAMARGGSAELVLVVEHEEEVAGFASLGPEDGREEESDVGELYAIHLDPDCWGRGIGGQLFDAVVAALRGEGYNEAVLGVVPENARARSLYDSRGWRPDGAERQERSSALPSPTSAIACRSTTKAIDEFRRSPLSDS
jgi:ribosomal protein S18 acetylase RimI-like enzyme